jgi:hypothetical protein
MVEDGEDIRILQEDILMVGKHYLKTRFYMLL